MKRVSPGIRNRLIGYPVLFGGLYFGLCLMLANAYLKPARSVPKTPEKLSDVSIQTAAGADPAWATPALAEHKPVGNVVFVMAHGYGGTRAAWRGVIEKVRDAGFEAVAPCMPGQDASPDKTVGFGLKEAKVIVDTVRWARSQYPTSRPPKIILLGVSMGGAASWLASEQIPNEVDAVITEGAYARFDQTIDRWFDSFLPHGSSILSPVIFFARRIGGVDPCLLYTSPSPRDGLLSRMPSSA